MAKKASKKESTGQPNFEEALVRLEGIVHLLEEGDVGLNEALARYEEGVRLLRQSYDLLEHAERRIELLSGVDAQGNPISQPVEDQPTRPRDATTHRQAGARSSAGGEIGDSGADPQARDNDIDAPGGVL